MNFSEPPTKKYKRPKSHTQSTTNPDLNKQRRGSDESLGSRASPPLCPLLAKDSEWADHGLLPPQADRGLRPSQAESSRAPENQVEEVLQLVDCEDGPGTKPLAVMFPDLVDKDPETLQGVMTKAMSTTEVTKHLVDLKQKANFTFMKKSNRLIPREKIWLDSLTESTNSSISLATPFSSQSSDYEADVDTTEDESSVFMNRVKRRNMIMRTPVNSGVGELTQCIETPDEPIAPEGNAPPSQTQNLRVGKSIDLNNGYLSMNSIDSKNLGNIMSSEDNAPICDRITSTNEADKNQQELNDKTKRKTSNTTLKRSFL